MKFISILTTALFLFAATATFATENPTTSNQEIELNKKKFGGEAEISVLNRTAQVTDLSDASIHSRYEMSVIIKKGGDVLLQETSSRANMSIDMSNLPAGLYIMQVKTPKGISLHPIQLK